MRSMNRILYVGVAASSLALAPSVRAEDEAASGTTDSQIVQRVLALNESERRASDAVKGKLSDPDVWQLAQRMSVDHTALGRKFGDLSGGGQTTDASGTEHAKVDVSIANASGADLDKAYIAREVKSHQAMMAALDRELIPNATSPELQRRLIGVRAEVAAHLQNAQAIQHAQWIVDAAQQQRADISKEISNSGP